MQYETMAIAFVVGGLVATLGALVGVGGGFIIVPLAAAIFPGWSAGQLTGFSLAFVAANALAGTTAHVRASRVDLKSAPWFALATAPGAILGAIASGYVARRPFEIVFGVGLVALAAWLLVGGKPRASGMPAVRRAFMRGDSERRYVDASGHETRWTFSFRLGIAGSLVVGFVSSFFGIGGGVIQVPFLVTMLSYPTHVAAGTSLLVLAFSSTVGTVVHALRGDYTENLALVLATAAGAVVGGVGGARLSAFVSAQLLQRILALSLVLAGLRLIVR